MKTQIPTKFKFEKQLFWRFYSMFGTLYYYQKITDAFFCQIRTGFIGCFLEEMSVLWTLHPPHLLFLAFLLNFWNLLFSKINGCIYFRQIRTGFIGCFLEELSVLWTLHQPPLPTVSHLRPSWKLLKRTLTTSNNSRYAH